MSNQTVNDDNRQLRRDDGERKKKKKRDVSPSLPAHTAGIREGNATGSYRKMKGHHEDGTSTAARSTGINADARNPISPDMPNLSPA